VNGASLDVKGVIRGGRDTATQGGDILVGRAGSDGINSTYPTTLNVFGSQFSSANTVIGYGTRPRSGAAGYESSWAGSSIARVALEIGITQSTPGLALYTVPANIDAVGTVYAPTELLTVNTTSMVYNGGLTTLTNIGGGSALKLTSTSSSSAVGNASPLWINHPKNSISLFLGDQSSTSSYTADEYTGNIRFNGTDVAWGDISYYPNGDSGNGSFRFTRNGSTVSTTPNAIVGVGGLKVVDGNESTTLTNFTQALTDAGINITTEYTANAYTPGIFWSTQDNNSTKPKAGIFLLENSNGTSMILGTSNTYTTGITSLTTINPSGDLNIGSGTVSTTTDTGALTVVGGAGIAGALYVGGITTAGGITMGGALTVGGAARINSAAVSNSTGTGALIVAGGVGVAGALYAAGITSSGTLNAASFTNGNVSPKPTTSTGVPGQFVALYRNSSSNPSVVTLNSINGACNAGTWWVFGFEIGDAGGLQNSFAGIGAFNAAMSTFGVIGTAGTIRIGGWAIRIA
jgi:hypothetical protein